MAEEDWSARRQHLLSEPSAEGLAVMCEAIVPGSRCVRRQRLGGGLDSATYALDLRTPGGELRRVVLKRYMAGDRHLDSEWDGLRIAERLPVPSPTPLALDREGHWFGGPALVIARLPGRPQVNRLDSEPWLRQMAGALVSIHTAVPEALAGSQLGRASPAVRPPTGTTRSRLAERSFDALAGGLPADDEPVLCHGDFHPGNLLWYRGRLSGVVDWSDVRLGSRWNEVAYCRTDLVVLLGWRAADRLLDHYQDLSGVRARNLALWDLHCALGAMRDYRFWLIAYRELGGGPLTRPQMAGRLSVFMRRALQELREPSS